MVGVEPTEYPSKLCISGQNLTPFSNGPNTDFTSKSIAEGFCLRFELLVKALYSHQRSYVHEIENVARYRTV